MPKPKQKWKKEFDEDRKLENMLRSLVMKGYEMGKKQAKTPYKYTLDTDIAKKEWKFIQSLLKEQREEIEDYWRKKCKTAKCKTADESYKAGQLEQREEMIEEIEKLIAKEMLICYKENQPTSRLTSLVTKLKKTYDQE